MSPARAVGPLNGAVSFWQASLGPSLSPHRPALAGPVAADVAVVGAGYTGLWTAIALADHDPGLRIVVVEAATVGYGASGRNGGWLSGLLPGDRDRMASGPGGRRAVIATQRALFAAVDDVVDWCRTEGIDIDARRSGSLAVATTAAELRRLGDELAADRGWGYGPDDLVALSAAEVADRVAVDGARGGLFTPHCARIQPAKLVRGLGVAAERRGVVIHEHSPALTLQPGRVETAAGRVDARWVVRATEGFTASLPGLRRRLLPMSSSMVVTEPLPPAVWAAIGWQGAETLRDGAHAYTYAQRTADDRIAVGGRGIPYRFGSQTDRDGRVAGRTVSSLEATIARLWPAAAAVPVAHAWSGVLGVARDWCPTVCADPATRMAWAGGYVGDGVTTAHLAGRTLADLIVGADTDRTHLAWVDHRSRAWEPEPLRWLGVHGVYTCYRAADRTERARPDDDRSSPWAGLGGLISGR